MTTVQDLIENLKQTNQFHSNSDVSADEVVSALEAQAAEIERLTEQCKLFDAAAFKAKIEAQTLVQDMQSKLDAQAAEIERLKLHIKHIGNDALRKENHALQSKLDAMQSVEPIGSVTDDGFPMLYGHKPLQPKTKLYTHPKVAEPLTDAEIDAARYRVLRDEKYQRHEDDISVSDACFNTYFGTDLDSAVDALCARYDGITKGQQ